jgi:transketolase
MEYNPRTIRTLSILGQRGSLGTALLELARSDKRIIALVADVGSPSGLDRFGAELPDQFMNVGIAEQNMIGVAAGLSASGHIPFAFTLANFAAMRAGEQVRQYMGYMHENVKVVGFGGGFALGMFGNTHYGVEDIGAIRSIENIVILSPSDGLSTVKAAYAAAEIEAPVYIRLTGVINTPVLYREDFDFEIGKAISLKTGDDVAIFATGVVAANALKAAEILDVEHGISTSVVDMHTIKPIDAGAVEDAFSSKLIVTVEEHSTTGGLGTAVAEVLAQKSSHPQLLRIGVEGGYLPAGDYPFKIEQFGLDQASIVDKILSKYKRRAV